MALDIKLFAPVARATNAIYMYVPDAAGTTQDGAATASAGDTWATVKAAKYFDNAQLVGSVKAGDIVLVNAQGTFGILLVTAVDVKAKTITTKVATLGA
jgi:hypothetical protein